jgi:hypothetical protein
LLDQLVAPRKSAPELMPTASPSPLARACAIRMASPSHTSTTGSSQSRSTTAGTNSSLMAAMRCLSTWWPVRSVGEYSGSSGCTRTFGNTERSARPTPMTVPPVPTPVTNALGRRPNASSCSRISGPVVLACARTFAWLSNCRGRNTPSCSRAKRSARCTEPTNPPSAADTGTISAPKLVISSERSLLIPSGM